MAVTAVDFAVGVGRPAQPAAPGQIVDLERAGAAVGDVLVADRGGRDERAEDRIRGGVGEELAVRALQGPGAAVLGRLCREAVVEPAEILAGGEAGVLL